MSEPKPKEVYEYVSITHPIDAPEWYSGTGHSITYGYCPPRQVFHFHSEEESGIVTTERLALIELPRPFDEDELNAWINSKPEILDELLPDIEEYVD